MVAECFSESKVRIPVRTVNAIIQRSRLSHERVNECLGQSVLVTEQGNVCNHLTLHEAIFLYKFE